MTITLAVNMITRQMTLFFFYLIIVLYPLVGIFHFCISRPSKFTSMGSLRCIIFCSVKYTHSSQLTQISSSYIKFSNFWYITCLVLNLITIWSPSNGLHLSGLEVFQILISGAGSLN